MQKTTPSSIWIYIGHYSINDYQLTNNIVFERKFMRYYKLLIIFFSTLFFTACTDDSVSTGSSLLDNSDNIVVGCDTFSLQSQMIIAQNFNSSPDSMLLGEADNMFGTIDADILTQLACPVGYRYPESSEVDSVVLFLFYRTWFGSGESPLSIRVYELDRSTFDYDTPYPLDLDVTEFCSFDDSIRLTENDYVFTAKNHRDSVYASSALGYTPCIRMKLNSKFTNSFFGRSDFSSQEIFNKNFKGLYITSSFGGSTVLYITSINLAVYYHFSYSKLDKDTVVNDSKVFYANSEVRQVNRVNYPINNLEKIKNDSITYVVAPGNIYTRISIPMFDMSSSIKDSLEGRRPYVNKAELVVPVLNFGTNADVFSDNRDKWAQPAEKMLLIKEKSARRFFKNNELPSDTCAILSDFTIMTDANGKQTSLYSYDLAELLTNQLRENQTDSVLQMLLIPVDVSMATTQSSIYSSSATSSITAVQPEQTISVTAIRSAQNAKAPMVLDVTYTGL